MAAEAAVSSAVLKLADLLRQKANFLRGVAREVQQLKDELQGVECFLRHAAEEKADDQTIRGWISETRAVAHDAEDAVEVFIFKVERARMMLGKLASSPNYAYHLNKFSRAIKSLRKRLHDIERRRLDYRIPDLGDRPESSRRSRDVEPLRRLAYWQKDKHAVGLEKDVELLLEKAILDEREGLSIAAVVGLAGIGKSTLARIVQNHGAVADRFERRAWAVVSKEVEPRDIIKELLLQLMTPIENKGYVMRTVEKLEFPNLLELLCQRLQGKRYFIVLDDLWYDEHWDALATAFPDEGKGSRLLLTSRSPVTQDYNIQYVHTMKCLDSDESWMLFSKTVPFDNTEGLEEKFENIGRQIVNKCNGLPLAISLVGGLLMKQRRSKSGWEKVLEQMMSHLDIMQAVLELSYQNLPPELKSCFLCLGFFKEDATIKACKLVDVWIAEGFIPQEGEESMEEMAMSYLEELVDRNMVQIKDITIDGRIKSCQMHDLVRDLSIKKAEEEISLELLKEDGKSESSYQPRHRVLYCSRGRFNDSIYGNKHIRSLFVRGGPPYLFTASFSSYWMSFQLLRVLDFEECKSMTRLPTAISALIGLRYLSLRNTDISDLPNWLPSLKNLKVLDLRGLLPVEMSDIIGKMCSLRHLYASAFYFNKPPKISCLKLLQTLSYVNFNDADMEQVTEMTSLCKLGINLFRVSNSRRLLNLLERLKNLVQLKLNYCGTLNLDRLSSLQRVTRLKLGGEIPFLPYHFPPNLSHLSLVSSRLKEDPMPFLQNLPKLGYLKLYIAYEGEEMVISHDGFPVLKVLRLHCLWKLRNIQVENGAMPELRRLEINRCSCLESVPGEMRGIMSELEELKIVTSTEIASKLRAEASEIISNIAYVQIMDDSRLDKSWKLKTDI